MSERDLTRHMSYLLLELLHLLGAAVLFGTGLGIAFFVWFGCREALRGRRFDLYALMVYRGAWW